MYHFSPDLDVSSFAGVELQQICVGKFDLQLRFSSGLCIAAQTTVRVVGNGWSLEWIEGNGWTSLEFQHLLNEQVTDATVANERLLELRFGNGLVLQLFDDSDQYESMQIYYPGHVAPVVV